MPLSRYQRAPRIRGGTLLGTSIAGNAIFRAVESGQMAIDIVFLRANQRLDQVAFDRYGDGRLWWVIAAASGIGWAPQCPEGTVLQIPTDLKQVENLIG